MWSHAFFVVYLLRGREVIDVIMKILDLFFARRENPLFDAYLNVITSTICAGNADVEMLAKVNGRTFLDKYGTCNIGSILYVRKKIKKSFKEVIKCIDDLTSLSPIVKGTMISSSIVICHSVYMSLINQILLFIPVSIQQYRRIINGIAADMCVKYWRCREVRDLRFY